jgi:hypothetical protein
MTSGIGSTGRFAGPASVLVINRGVAALKTAWEDPLGIDVNSVQNTTDWHWNGNCVVSPVQNSQAQDWYTPTGWWRDSQNFQHSWNCTQTTSSSFGHFANDNFCPGGGNRTHAYYDRNIVHGRYNGAATRSQNSWISGGCSFLLHKYWVFCVDSPIGGDTDCTTSF